MASRSGEAFTNTKAKRMAKIKDRKCPYCEGRIRPLDIAPNVWECEQGHGKFATLGFNGKSLSRSGEAKCPYCGGRMQLSWGAPGEWKCEHYSRNNVDSAGKAVPGSGKPAKCPYCGTMQLHPAPSEWKCMRKDCGVRWINRGWRYWEEVKNESDVEG